jgi:hypothetical protein
MSKVLFQYIFLHKSPYTTSPTRPHGESDWFQICRSFRMHQYKLHGLIGVIKIISN